MGFVASICQPSTLRMLIWPEASNAQKNIAAVSADGSTVCVLILRLNSSCSRSIAFVVRALRHWLGGRRVKVNRRSPAFLHAVGDGTVFETPLADEGLAAGFDLLAHRGVDHIVVVGGVAVDRCHVGSDFGETAPFRRQPPPFFALKVMRVLGRRLHAANIEI